MRSKAKMVNFGIIYGISAFGLSQRLSISRGEAATIIKQYQAAYPGVQEYLDRTIAFAQQHEYVETVTGRRRYIRDINAKNRMVRSGAERNAINAPIQGTAADLIKIAMIKIEKLLQKQQTKTTMLLQVHDELVSIWHPMKKLNSFLKSNQSCKKPFPCTSLFSLNQEPVITGLKSLRNDYFKTVTTRFKCKIHKIGGQPLFT